MAVEGYDKGYSFGNTARNGVYKDSKLVSLYKNISIVLVCLTSSLFVDNFIILYSGLSARLANILIFLNLGFIAYRSFSRISFDNFQKKLVIILFIIIFYLLMIWGGLYGFNLTGPGTRGTIKIIVMGLFFFVIFNDPKFHMIRFCNTVLYIGFIFALLSLFLYFGYQFGFVNLKSYTYHGYDAGRKVLGNIGGYLDPRIYYEHAFLRNSSYWSEPGRFAQFLQFPFFFALQKYFNNKNIVNVTLLLIISIAMLTTFSVANFFGTLCAFVFFSLINRKSNKYGYKSQHLNVKKIILFIVFSIALIQFYTITNQYHYGSKIMIGKSTHQTIVERIDRFNIVYDEIVENPFGSIAFGQEYCRNASAFGSVIILGGFPLLILCIIMLFVFYKKLIFELKDSVNGLMIVGSIAFCIGHIWYGGFTGIPFLFNLALFSTIFKYNKLDCKLM